VPRDKAKVDLHIKQWEHNRSLISQIPRSHPDWIVTVIFYTAVHAIDAALTWEGAPFWNHDTRFAALGNINRFKRVRELYHVVYDLCRKVRYTAKPNEWIPPGKIDALVLRAYLLPIEQSIENLTGLKMQMPIPDLSHLSDSIPRGPSQTVTALESLPGSTGVQ
jgi:hypothetical protein